MKKSDRIYVAGHRGMVGGAILRRLKGQGYDNLVTRTHAELNLIDRNEVDKFFAKEKINHVFLAAAKVGGIMANDTQSGDFIRDNLYIQTNVIDAAYRNGAQKFVFLGSSCIYPKFAEQPIKESSLLTGELEPTNSAYAIAKIAGKEMCDAYRKQFGFDAFTVMPSNVYGPGDNFDPQSSHVAAALMRRFHEAKISGLERVEAWGTGAPLREFIFADDLADACLFLIDNYKEGGMINAGSAQEVSIRELTAIIADTVGFAGEIAWDASKPDGTPRKIMDSSRLRALGWAPKTLLHDGMRQMYAWFLENVST